MSAPETELRLVGDEIWSPEETRRAWEARERRDVYLLRDDVDVVVSADPRVTARTEDGSGPRLVVIADPRDQPDAPWDSLAGYAAVDASYLANASPLGYDVCDATRYSALTNCGHTDPESLRAARATWGARIDARHLLMTLANAQTFRREADARVPEHAPFFVVRVFERAG